jgi:hypothetical protein
MTVMTAVPRTVVGAYLKVARLPISMVSRVTGRAETWPPTLAFDRFEANVDTVLGTLLKDEQLVDRGRLQQARVEELRRAATLRTVAEEERLVAETELEEKRRRADQQREEAERRAEEREQQVARQAQARMQEVEQNAARKAAAVRQNQAAQEKAVSRQERKAKQQALGKEVEALTKAKDAVEASETAALVEDAIEGSKAARKTS